MQRAGLVIVVVVVLALLGLGLYAVCGQSEDGTLSCLRDVAIIVLVLETFAVTILLAVIVLLFGRLITTIQQEVTPVLRSAKRTADTVQGTTAFVSDTFVAPLVGLAGFASGLKGTLLAILAGKKSRRG